MQRPLCHRPCQRQVLEGICHNRCCLHHVSTRVHTPGGRRAPSKGRAVGTLSHATCLSLTYTCRYANVDYVVVRSTSHNLETKKIASYDIMCQWNINLRKRLKCFPLKNAKRLDNQIVARVVPKFHLAAHKEDCRINYSLNYEPGVGRSDMEGPERTWFGLQGGGSTRDQGPGYWSDSMDDKFGHWNWSKLVRLGESFLFPFYFQQLNSCL